MKDIIIGFLVGVLGAVIAIGTIDMVFTVYRSQARIQSLEAQVQSLTSKPSP